MTEWGMRVARGGCWFSWKNLEDLLTIFEDALPTGQLTVRYTKNTRKKTREDLVLNTAETHEWADLASLRVHLGSEPVITELQIEVSAPSDPQKISFKIGGDRLDKIFDWPHMAVARIEGGSKAWEEGVALRVGAVFNEARFLGRRLTKWISRLTELCILIALWSLIYEPSGTPGTVGASALVMALVLFRTHYQLTRSMLVNEPKRIRKFLVRRSRNHPNASGPTQSLVVVGVLASLAGIISTLVALLDYFFPRG
ncbi:hypothetical protein OG763_00545 [Streptomyces sp. NBC_01230]|uniref:hypothetical protein n=1 Tax=unclassified Streptomyces TaxID=2593676 RepID=UPI002E156FE1|nr:hypothetical protein OG763_00545 [Streptomyces sp. NBC_01230]